MKYLLLSLLFVSTTAISGPFLPVAKVPVYIIDIAENHITQASKNGLGWSGFRIKSVSELYRSGIDGPAYYEFNIYNDNEPAGFLVVSTGPHDFMVSHWATSGVSPAESLVSKYGEKSISRLLKEDVFSYGAELSSGEIVEIATRDLKSKSDERVAYEQSLAEMAEKQWNQYRDNKSVEKDDEWTRFETPGPSPRYGQFKSGVGPNTSKCLSGCGATAWAMLFGWVDIQSTINDVWKDAWGVYREGGGRGEDVVAPEENTPGVEKMSWEIRNQIGTWCYDGEGATGPWNMLKVSKYLKGRTSITVAGKYNVFGKTENRIKKYAISYITNAKTPVIIGTGWLKHYPMAISYAYKVDKDSEKLAEWFFVNQGWSGTGNEWVAASTWFAGVIKR